MEHLDDVDGMTIGAEEDQRLDLATEPVRRRIRLYPEHAKMALMRPELDAIASFLEMMEAGEFKAGNGAAIQFACMMDDEDDLGNPKRVVFLYSPSIEKLLEQWSGIDMNKIEAEKREMLEVQRQLNKS